MSCDKLRCSECNKRIVRFADNVKWNDEVVDYIYVRNYNTYPEKLREGCTSAPGYACYACQCKWVSVCEAKQKVEEVRSEDGERINWHCAGH